LDQQSASFRNKNPNFGSPGQSHTQPAGQQSTPSNSKPWSEISEADRSGMAGLEAMFRYRDDRTNGQPGDQTLPQKQKTQAMLMGHDLSSAALGLDLESSEPLYPTFSVFGDLYDGSESSLAQRRPIPDFPLSESYNVTNVPSLLPRMSSMSDGQCYPCLPS
jgi:CCR4-NOT transcription complex subunit 2